MNSHTIPSRRRFLKTGVLFLTASGKAVFTAADDPSADKAKLRIGLLTDVHYAQRDTAGTRRYRESLRKMGEAVAALKERKAAITFELGDFTDEAPDAATKISYIKRIDAEFRKAGGECRHVLGNHCVDNVTKEEHLAAVGEDNTFYSFDREGFHFVVLDACFRSDGEPYRRGDFDWTDSNVSSEQLQWLKSDLASTAKPAIVAIHQRLDCGGNIGVKNAHLVREILEDSGRVRVVFQGHHHQNDYTQIGGIHYCTLRSVVDGPFPEHSAYAVVDFFKDGNIRVEGFREQDAYRWS